MRDLLIVMRLITAEEEAAELERFGELEHLMQLVKARAEISQDEDMRSRPRISASLRREGPKERESVASIV